MRDINVRSVLRSRLEHLFGHDPSTVIIDELGISQGRVRADMVAVNGHLHGYEIKAAADSLARFAKQVEFYSKVFDYAALVTAEKHLDSALQMLPDWWGVYVATGSPPDELKIRLSRNERMNPNLDPSTLVELLWRSEALALLLTKDAARGVSSRPRRFIWDRVCEVCTLDEIRDTVRHQLKERRPQPRRQLPAARPAIDGGSSRSFSTR